MDIGRGLAVAEQMIPKILHLIWMDFSGKDRPLPRSRRVYYDRWRELHPDWDIRLWDAKSVRVFVEAAYPELLAVYDAYPKPIQRVDAFRYLVLNRLGGVYADLDVDPLRSINALIAPLECFVGVEPGEHIAGDRLHAGIPFLLSNAFMGSAPAHPFWQTVIDLLPKLAEQEVFSATGPAMLTGAALRAAPNDRPSLLLPSVWSPYRDGGAKSQSDKALKEVLTAVAPVIESDSGPFVSHLWHTLWVKWYQKNTRVGAAVQIPTKVKWWTRANVLHRALNAVIIADPLRLYTDQHFATAVPGARVFVAVRLDGPEPLDAGLGAALKALTYPGFLVRYGVWSAATEPAAQEAVRASVEATFGEGVACRFADADSGNADALTRRAAASNWLLEEGARESDKVLLVGGDVRVIPPEALELMLGAPRPIVAASLVDMQGKPDLSVFRYRLKPNFRTLYKVGGLSGGVEPLAEFRAVPADQLAFRLVALDGVGDRFVLIDAAAIRAGARFAETVYKLHRHSDAFGIMARDMGFESAALPGLEVRRA